jgi:predicted transport protein
MKITGTRSTVTIEENGKKLILSGELTTEPSFYADRDSIQYWVTENGKISITEEEKLDLINRIIEESRKCNFTINFLK